MTTLTREQTTASRQQLIDGRNQDADARGDIALRAELETQTQDETRHAEELEKNHRNWRD